MEGLPIESWQQDPDFQALPEAERARIYQNYFDKEIVDDEFRVLPDNEQVRIRNNFLSKHGISDANKLVITEKEKPSWYKQEISLPDKIAKSWNQVATDIEESAKRIGEGLISPEAPIGATETAAHIGTMTYGVPAVGFGEIIDLAASSPKARKTIKKMENVSRIIGQGGATLSLMLLGKIIDSATEGKYKVAEKIGEKLIYQPQTKSGEVIRDILFSPFSAAEKIGEKRAGTLYEELVEKYGPEDIRTSLYPTIRKTLWDILGILATGKAGHVPRSPKAKVPAGFPKLDTSYAKDLILTRMAEEKAKVGEQPLAILEKKEAGLKGKIPVAGKAAKRMADIEQAMVELGDKERLAEMKQPYKGPALLLKKAAERAREPGGIDVEAPLRKATEAVGGEYGLKERGIEITEPKPGEYGVKITDRSIPPGKKFLAQSQINAVLKRGGTAKDAAIVFEKFLRQNQMLSGKEGLVEQLKQAGGKIKTGRNRIAEAAKRRQAFINREITPEEETQAQVEQKGDINKQIVDEVKQPVDVAVAAAKSGKTKIADLAAKKAQENGKKLKLADGPETEKLVDEQLGRLPKEKIIESEQPKAKEPWEMTKSEWYQNRKAVLAEKAKVKGIKTGKITINKSLMSRAKSEEFKQTVEINHYKRIQQALKEGKPVPENVLAEYPELKGPGEIPTKEKLLKPEGGELETLDNIDVVVKGKTKAGEIIEYKEKASTAIKGIEDQINQYKKLLDCVTL